MSTQDPDATMPTRGFGADETAPVTRPNIPDVPVGGGGGGDSTSGGGPGMWDDGQGDRRRMWFIAGGVLVLGILVGTVIALAIGGGDNENGASTTTSSSSTSTSTTSASTSTTSTTTAAPGPQILQFTANPSPVMCPEGGGIVNVNLVWATTNTTGVTISIDGPVPFASYGPTDNKQFPFNCPAGQHTYLLTANGQNGQKVQEQIVIQGIAPTTTTT